jgi:hypothetical protein
MSVTVDDHAVTELVRALDLAGVLGNALPGGVIARAEKLDACGR